MDRADVDPVRVEAEQLQRRCDFPGCERRVRSRWATLCEAHYYQRRRGRPLTPIRERIQGDMCQIEGCETPRSGGRYCEKHRARIARNGDPHAFTHQRDRRFPRGPASRNWAAEPSYDTVHQRLRRARGRASEHLCATCGGPASEWAYIGPRESGERKPYSSDLSMYTPMCRRCHTTLDRPQLSDITRPRRVEWRARAADMYAAGMSVHEIAAVVGRAHTSVLRGLKRDGVQMRTRSEAWDYRRDKPARLG